MKYMSSKSRITKYIVPILQDIIDKEGIELYAEPITRSIGNRTSKDVKNIDVKERLFKWKGLKTDE